MLLYLSISYQSIFHPSHSVHSCAPPPFYKSSFYLSITVLICPYLPQSFLYFFIPPFPRYFDPAFLYPFISLSLQLYISPPFYLAINSISPSLQCFTPLSFALIYPSSLTALHYYVPPCSLTSFFPPSLQSSQTSTPLFPSPHLHLSILSCFSSSLHPPIPDFPIPLYLSPLVQKFSSYFLSFYNSTTLHLSLSSYIHPPISALHLCRFIFCQSLHLLQSTILHHSIFASSRLSSHFLYRAVKQCNTELLFRDQF